MLSLDKYIQYCVYYHNHHHHISFMELGHLLTRSGLTYPEVSSKVYYDSFCQSDSSVSLIWVIYFETFYLHVVSSFSCIPVICPKLMLFLIPLQFVYLFYNLSKCILLFFQLCLSKSRCYAQDRFLIIRISPYTSSSTYERRELLLNRQKFDITINVTSKFDNYCTHMYESELLWTDVSVSLEYSNK